MLLDLFPKDLFGRDAFKPAREARAFAARLLPHRDARPVEVAVAEPEEPRFDARSEPARDVHQEPSSDDLLSAMTDASEDSMSDAFVMQPLEESPRLSRAQVMTRIIELNPTASIDYLARFNDEALADYLAHVDTAIDPRRSRIGWLRKATVPAVAVRETL